MISGMYCAFVAHVGTDALSAPAKHKLGCYGDAIVGAFILAGLSAARMSNQAEAKSFCSRTGNGLIFGSLFFWAFQRS
jgi:hypothetical protein